MNILFKVMSAALMASKTMSAIGVTIMVSYGIYEFVKKQHKKEEEDEMRYLK